MRYEIRWRTGLDPALVAVTREHLGIGLVRVAGRIERLVLWRELRTESGKAAFHWVVRLELHDGRQLVVVHPDPEGDRAAARQLGERVSRAASLNLLSPKAER